MFYICTMKKIVILLVLYMMCFKNYSWSQSNSQNTADIVKQSNELKKSFDSKDEKETAKNYYELGVNYYKAGEYEKSESNFTKALQLFEKENDKKNIARTSRALALSQEKLKKLPQANFNYSNANKYESSSIQKRLNTNDALRTVSNSTAVQESSLKENIEVLKNTDKKEEIAENYEKLADLNYKNKEVAEAKENLNKAYFVNKTENTDKAVEINKKITDIYVKEDKMEEAIEVKKSLIKEDFVQKDTKNKAEQIQELASLYEQNNNSEEAIKLLENSYQIALENGHTLAARNSIVKLDSIYKKQNKSEKSLIIYRGFLLKLAEIIKKDKNLIDTKIISETEEKIELLEKERKLKDALIEEKSNFNTGLIIFILLLTLFLGLILFAFKKLKIKSKKIALQSLRREMNPHFIFNSLNSVNHFISQNDELAANQYLTKFSKLMRGIMENSTDDFISFTTELELLENYLALEKSRFNDLFDYEIKIDNELKNKDINIPSMLIQPFLENAIWHGLRYRDSKGMLSITLELKNKTLVVIIQDNGIGIAKSKELKTKNQLEHKGRGMNNTVERIKLLNELYKNKIHYSIQDSENGVTVNLNFKDICK